MRVLVMGSRGATRTFTPVVDKYHEMSGKS